jgi:NAD(P)-dependent dehydrogenase (short-subunit alcohol dehydrogenase family)
MTGTVARQAGAGLAIAATVAAALPALTATLALELAPVRVNLIATGFVDTPLSATLLGDQLEQRRATQSHAPRSGASSLRFLAPRVPAALLVVVAAIVASGSLDLASEGVAVVGNILSGLPELAAPSPTIEDTLTLLPAAVGIFLVCFADAILTARSFAGKHNDTSA